MSSDSLWEAEESSNAIFDALVNASTCFDIWSELQNGAKRYEYEPVVSNYPVFFETTIIAHLIAMSTLLYSVGEKRNDTHNIPGFLKLAKQIKPNDDLLLELERQVAGVKPLWIKLSRIRNEMFAHRKAGQNPINLFADIQLRPEEISIVIQTYKSVLSEACKLLSTRISLAVELEAASETEQLMLALGAVAR